MDSSNHTEDNPEHIISPVLAAQFPQATMLSTEAIIGLVGLFVAIPSAIAICCKCSPLRRFAAHRSPRRRGIQPRPNSSSSASWKRGGREYHGHWSDGLRVLDSFVGRAEHCIPPWIPRGPSVRLLGNTAGRHTPRFPHHQQLWVSRLRQYESGELYRHIHQKQVFAGLARRGMPHSRDGMISMLRRGSSKLQILVRGASRELSPSISY